MGLNSALSPSLFLVLALFLLSHSQLHYALVTGDYNIYHRKALEATTGRGNGGASETPAASPESPRLQQAPSAGGFASPLIRKVYPIIKRFQATVEQDPKGILKTWTGKDICGKHRYIGLECAIFPGTNYLALASVQFNQFNFGGRNLRLSGFLDKLEEVTIFHANSNHFLGTVPNISQIPYLFELDLSNNNLSGQFPTSVIKGSNLTFLDLRFNSILGSVPRQVFNLDVDVLFINNNNLFQRLPRNLGSITALYLTFANNRFTGTIPSSIGNIKYLREVLFLNNRLSGCLPYQIGLLNQATVFDVRYNHLTGPIPYSFGCLNSMKQLNLAKNRFYGTVPEIVCELPRIQYLSLSYNYFTQVGPKCRQLIKKKILDVRMNCIFDQPNQRPPAVCNRFFRLNLTCPNSKSLTYIPCGKNPNLQRADQELSDSVASPPISYNALAPDRLRSL